MGPPLGPDLKPDQTQQLNFPAERMPDPLTSPDEHLSFLKQCAVWARSSLSRPDPSTSEQRVACNKLLLSIVEGIESELNDRKFLELNKSGLENILQKGDGFFRSLRASQPTPMGPETPIFEWNLYSAEFEKIILDGEDYLRALDQHLTRSLPTGKILFAPPILYVSKMESYTDQLKSMRDTFSRPKQLSIWADLIEIRSWLDYCDKHHKLHCQLSSESAQKFRYRPERLIDVDNLCLVLYEPNHRYAALSYVWGKKSFLKASKGNIEYLKQPHSLRRDHASPLPYGIDTEPPRLSSTVSDAIELTRRLGERFLWVDALCIIQDDEMNMQQHLSGMGSIYANAYITIVAANGAARAGLRGLEHFGHPFIRKSKGGPIGTPRNDALQAIEQIGLHHCRLRSSAWNSRAWTFQEQIFSRRLLVLDQHGISWECHCAVWFEGMEGRGEQCANTKQMIAQGFSFQLPPSLHELGEHIKQYNRRKLTYPEDALDAFAGILGVLDEAFGGFIAGLPCRFFDSALLWYIDTHEGKPVKKRKPRRPEGLVSIAPTWSWAAWATNHSETACFPDASNNPENSAPLVQWYYHQNRTEGWRRVSEHGLQQMTCGTQTHNTPSEAVTAEAVTLDGEVESAVLPTLLDTSITTHLLFSRPLRAFFHITALACGPIPWPRYWGKQVIGSAGVCIGKIRPCERLDFGSPVKDIPCELVAISESVVDGLVYNVMWIEWEGGVAHRKGVGIVEKTGWEMEKSEHIDLVLR